MESHERSRNDLRQLLVGKIVQLVLHPLQLGAGGLDNGLEAGGGIVLLIADHTAQAGVNAAVHVDDTQVNVDALGDDVQHEGGLGIGGDLGTEGLLVVHGLDDLVAGGAHGLQDSAHHIQALTRDGGGDGYDGELVVEKGVVAVLLGVVLRHGNHAVLLLHLSHGRILQRHDTKGRHSALTLGEHIADIVLLLVSAVGSQDLSAIPSSTSRSFTNSISHISSIL